MDCDVFTEEILLTDVDKPLEEVFSVVSPEWTPMIGDGAVDSAPAEAPRPCEPDFTISLCLSNCGVERMDSTSLLTEEDSSVIEEMDGESGTSIGGGRAKGGDEDNFPSLF